MMLYDGRTIQRILEFGERYCRSEKKIKVDEKERKKDIENNRDRIELTKCEMLNVMNDINQDLQFTMELCSDFEDCKLPTLSFSLYAESEGLKHTYFEKLMKNQVLIVSRSAISRQQLMNIMSNEIIRRMEVTSADLCTQEKIKIIDKFEFRLQLEAMS